MEMRRVILLIGFGLLAAFSAASENDFATALAKKYERVPLAHLPTPFEAMASLSAATDAPPLYIKRDDQTGLAFGGNKARKLEFIFADVLAKRSDVIVTWAGVQSNWARQTAAAARLHDIRPILILAKGEHSPHHGGNLLLDALMGADVRLVEPSADRAAVARTVASELRSQGHRPYVVPVGGSQSMDSMELPLGAIAYANGFDELWRQSVEMGVAIDHVVLATGSGGTQAGLMVGAKAVAPHVAIVGISVSREKNAAMSGVSAIAEETAQALGLDMDFPVEETIVIDDYMGDGYGVLNEPTARAVAEVARHEAILLDPVYTGKAMAGMLDLVRKGYFEGSRGIVFLHTGGTPALFVYEEELLRYVK